jgi:hypothetical protein
VRWHWARIETQADRSAAAGALRATSIIFAASIVARVAPEGRSRGGRAVRAPRGCAQFRLASRVGMRTRVALARDSLHTRDSARIEE